MERDRPEMIVLVSIDDLRADCVASADSKAWLRRYGSADALETPTLDALYEQGVSFTRASSASSYTPPSHASLFTGKYPSEHGVKTFFNRLEGHQTLAHALSKAGYQTVAWIENMALDMLDVTGGFDRVVCPFEEDSTNLFDVVEDAASADKLFLFVHLFDVHKPYGYATGGTERHRYNDDYPECLDPLLPDTVRATDLVEEAQSEAAEDVPNYDELTDPLREYADYRSLDYLIREALESELGEGRFEHLVRMYVEGVNRFDRNRLSDLLEALRSNLDEDDLLMFTSDHGETRCRWGDRDDFWNSFNVSEGAVRVPLIVEGSTVLEDDLANDDTPVSHVDVYPTVLEAANLDSNDVSGESLLDSLDSNRPLFNESWYYSGGVDFFGNMGDPGDGGLSEIAVRVGNCKLIRSFSETGTPERVVRRLDAPIPEETADPPSCQPFEHLAERLETVLDGVSQTCSPDLGTSQQTMEDRLKALGYLE